MIPTEEEAKKLWDTFHLPEQKRVHVVLVARVALFLANRLESQVRSVAVNKPLLLAAALLHDIDKAIPRLAAEQHPDTAVRVLEEVGMGEVSAIVKTHPLHAILHPTIAPKTWEEKLLYLADKMVKYEVIGVDKRFALWNAEHLPSDAQTILDQSYPKVKELEKQIFTLLAITPDDVVKLT